MIIAKKEEFTKNEIKLADFAKALSHPVRIAILKALAERRECICGDIVSVLPLAQSTISQHLKVLKNVGLIKGRIDGPRSCYCIDWKNFERFKNLMNEAIKNLEKFKTETSC